MALGYTSVQVIRLRREKQRHWDESSKTIMLVQAAYYEGYNECLSYNNIKEEKAYD